MESNKQPVFAEIEFPLNPGFDNWLVIATLSIIALIGLYFVFRYTRKNKQKLLTYIRYQLLLHRSRHHLESMPGTAEKIYRLLLSHYHTPILPNPPDLPSTMQEQVERWIEFKNRLNAARFSNSPISTEDIQWLLIHCRWWIK